MRSFQNFIDDNKGRVKQYQKLYAFFWGLPLYRKAMSCVHNRLKHHVDREGLSGIGVVFRAAGKLLVSQACVGNTVVGFKASIVDERHLRGWVSAFAFRAHQLLEWETMRCCCQKGITSYDFGGIESFDNPNGIDKFKMTFAKEGERVTYDNFLLGSSLLGKAGIAAYKLYKKVRK